MVIRSKAESIAAQAYREAQLKKTGCASAVKGFDNRWSNEIKLITDEKQKKKFTDIADSVKARWAAKCGDATAVAADSTTPWLATTAGQDALKEGLKGKTVTVGTRVFKVEQVVAVSKSDNADDKPFDTVEVALSVTGTDTVSMASVQTEIMKLANKIASDTGGDTSAPVKVVKITNRDAAALKDVWKL